MKLTLAVGILSSQTLLPLVSEAKILSNTKLDTDDPRFLEEPPVLRGGSNLVHVASRTATTPFKKKTNKKAVECIPPQGEFTEEDYDLGVLACATSSTTIVGQVCVPTDDSTLGGYCMDPPPLTDADSRDLMLGFNDGKLFRKFCKKGAKTSPFTNCFCYDSDTGSSYVYCFRPQPFDYNGCDTEYSFGQFRYRYDSDGILYYKFNCLAFSSTTVCASLYVQPYCFPGASDCQSCTDLGGIVIDCPSEENQRNYDCSNIEDGIFCTSECKTWPWLENPKEFLCTRIRPAGYCRVLYNGDSCGCTSKDGKLLIDCTDLDKGFFIDTSQKKPWKDLPVIQACAIPKPTKAPKPPKTPKPKKPRQLVSSETPDVDSAERPLIGPMNNLKEALAAANKEDANAEMESSALEN